ncbi:unnamed protein product [Symbiodinium pilosum]|uniref:Uncharacterized protein n=1 Tax=Symbiodinium pilosum TaxID=2952 RepID=A0A812M2M7_SYMPI|nr:unnamed protein product [Symbiodinium pilosum]
MCIEERITVCKNHPREHFELETFKFIEEMDSPVPPLLKGLQGNWYRAEDNLHVGEIQGRFLLWHAGWKMLRPASEIEIIDEEDIIIGGMTHVKLQVDDMVLIGEVCADAQPRIWWQDGDIWLKK